MRSKYTEPTDYIPKNIRKELGLGEYAEKPKDEKKSKDEANKKLRDYVNGNE